MANIAYGWIDFFHSNIPIPLDDMRNLLATYPQLFSFDGEYTLEHGEEKVSLHFTSRWTTDLVWDLLDSLYDSSVLGTWLVSVKVLGKGREDGTGHYILVKKSPNETVLKRSKK